MEKKINKSEQSGLFDLDIEELCQHPEHYPPNLLYIPQGKGYKHVCPRCKKVTIVIPPQYSF